METYKRFEPCFDPANPPKHLEWYLLIREIEAVAAGTGESWSGSLARIWELVNSGDYDAARDGYLAARDRWLS